MKSIIKNSLLGLSVVALFSACQIDEKADMSLTTSQSSSNSTGTADIIFKNDFSEDVGTLNISPSSASTWGNNQLNGTVYTGQQYTVYGVTDCNTNLDFRVLDTSGNSLKELTNQYVACDNTYTLRLY